MQKPVDPNAILPAFLMRSWTIENSTSTLRDFGLIDDAKGLNVELRSTLPGLDMSVVVGKWYVTLVCEGRRHNRSSEDINVLQHDPSAKMGRGFLL